MAVVLSEAELDDLCVPLPMAEADLVATLGASNARGVGIDVTGGSARGGEPGGGGADEGSADEMVGNKKVSAPVGCSA
jgi:hypothetical protein